MAGLRLCELAVPTRKQHWRLSAVRRLKIAILTRLTVASADRIPLLKYYSGVLHDFAPLGYFVANISHQLLGVQIG
jgi:hypothetical protein